MVAFGVAYESVLRLAHPVSIHFREAIPIAALGLVVNIASAWLLSDGHGYGHAHSNGYSPEHNHGHDRAHAQAHAHSHAHDHHHDHDHAHDDDHHDHAHARRKHHDDTNLRAAYVHVVADALISILAIAGLAAAWAFDWVFIDPLVGIVGAIVIASWAVSLMRAAGRVLLDTVPDPSLAERIRARIEHDGDRVCDLHVWQVGPGHFAVMASVVSASPQAPAAYKARLAGLRGLSHVTIEVHSLA